MKTLAIAIAIEMCVCCSARAQTQEPLFVPAPASPVTVGKGSGRIILADVNRDGHLEPNRVVIKLGDGRGHFKDAPGSPFAAPPEARVCVLADLTGDQRLDIVLRHQANLLTVLLNDGHGRFTPARSSPLRLDMPAYEVLVADVNRDQTPDLIVATVDHTAPFESRIAVFLGDGRGGFTPAPGSPFPAEPGAYNLAVGDINEDGKLDIAASSFEGNAVTLLLGR